jgi:nitroimidazol reductase NimA-like FMN-containing flavoprotein (pyridoxamine 5'-phosphate oxidase superfamily)
MRRRDREVIDICKIRDIIDSCHCCRLGFVDDGQVYIVPLSFGWEENDGRFIFYFHGASQGRKAKLIKTCPNVGFELDTGYALRGETEACTYTAAFKSVIGNGTVRPVDNQVEKIHGLDRLMAHCAGERNWHYEEKMLAEVFIFRLDVESLACKEHL